MYISTKCMVASWAYVVTLILKQRGFLSAPFILHFEVKLSVFLL